MRRREDEPDAERERGRPASFDRRSGEVHGSGSGAGGGGTPGEEHDRDPQAGSGAEPVGGPPDRHRRPA